MTNRIPTALALLAFTALPGAALIPVVPAAAQRPIICLARPSLTGSWLANDGGTYRLRQVGNTIWWVGMSGDDGKSWTHAFHGVRNGNVVNGRWADVNGPMGSGALTLQVRGNGTHLLRTAATGSGFSGTRWRRPGCKE